MDAETITYTVESDPFAHGTSRKSQIKATFAQLVAVLGEPQKHKKPDHSRVFWDISFSDGAVISVYDWNDDRRVEDVTEWNVAAHDFMTAYRIHDIIARRPIEV